MTTSGLAGVRRGDPIEAPHEPFGTRQTSGARHLGAIFSREIAFQVAILLALAVLTRITRLGDPTITGDEQFYLLVGDRLWHGALPFVDIWDRKPIGLFLLYAAFRPLSHDGILAYQIAALLFAAATAVVLARIACRVMQPVAATAAGALYLIELPMVDGAGGQSPVFYDLFTVSAALLVVRCFGDTDRDALWRNGLVAMLLTGLAIQVKYTALFEGIAFGLTMLWLHWRQKPRFLPLVGLAGALVAVALLPTLVAFGVYAIDGHAMAFVSANFVSIFQKTKPAHFSEVEAFLVPSAWRMSSILILSIVAMVGAFVRHRVAPVFVFALVWSAFAFVEFFAIGRYSDHYAIPLLMPLAIIVASLLDWRPFAVAASSLTILAVLALAPDATSRSRAMNDQARIAGITDALAPYAQKGCIYVYDGPPILYLTTGSCLSTRFPFPTHLADADEAAATDATVSMAALLRSRPSAVVTSEGAPINPRNPITQAMLASALAADYHIAGVRTDNGYRKVLIYARNDLR